MKSILIINRWNDELVSYANYIDHAQYRVFYLTDLKGEKIVPSTLAKGTYVTEYLNDLVVDDKAMAFIEKIPSLETIIAFSEVDQELAAFFRTKLSVKGTTFHDIKKFRNKIEMKRVAQAAGILVPAFASLSDKKSVSRLINDSGFSLILKPNDGVSSEGVYKVNSLTEFNQLALNVDMNHYQCEQFIAGKIYHADGLVQNGRLCIYLVSEYIHTCLDYTHGKPLGSVNIDDETFIERTKHFTQDVLNAFTLANGAFHLEFIVNEHDTIYFLEIGARVGGAQVPQVFKYIYGIDPFQEWSNIQLGNTISLNKNIFDEKYIGGWLLFPQPMLVPCKVKSCRRLKDIIPHILIEKLPQQRYIFQGNGEYRDVSGSYLYRANSTKEIKLAIKQTIKQFLIKTIPIKTIQKGEENDLDIIER